MPTVNEFDKTHVFCYMSMTARVTLPMTRERGLWAAPAAEEPPSGCDRPQMSPPPAQPLGEASFTPTQATNTYVCSRFCGLNTMFTKQTELEKKCCVENHKERKIYVQY